MQAKKRQANLELLRCIAMMMVVVLHFLGKGELLDTFSDGKVTAFGVIGWLMEGFCAVAVNLYMLLTGYFLCESRFKPSRMLSLLLQLWTYSVGIGLLGAAFGLNGDTPVDTHYLLTLLFPVSMEHYWFLTAYVYMMLFSPLLCAGVRALTQATHQVTILLLLVFFSLGKSVLPVRFEMDAFGYDCIWYMVVFLIAAYIRKYGIPRLEKKTRGVLLYLVCSLLISALSIGVRLATAATGRFELSWNMFLHYNHILSLLAAVGLFTVFLRIRVEGSMAKVVLRISPYCLGVYLLHENIGVRYAWQKWLGAGAVDGIATLVLTTLLAAIVVFAIGILVEALRVLMMGGMAKLLGKLSCQRALMRKVEALDACFAGEKKSAE